MSGLLGLEFWSKKDLVAEIARLKEENELRGAEVERLRADNKAHCTALMTTAMWEDEQDEKSALHTEIERLRAELASAQTIKRC